MFRVKFYGVRGSVPAPLNDAQVKQILKDLVDRYSPLDCYEDNRELKKALLDTLSSTSNEILTYGGNTPCVEVMYDNGYGVHLRFILDMGTGIRVLGNDLFPMMFNNGGLSAIFLLSHVHWDHIQGLPFFGPLYVNKGKGIQNKWSFYGGTDWQKTAEECLKGQMDPPMFPVSWKEISKITYYPIVFHEVHDMMSFRPEPNLEVTCRKLNHPQETYGWRLEGVMEGKKFVVAYTTDNEPYDPEIPDSRLLELAEDADLWITDCQYPNEVYSGKRGNVERFGWGHSYPTAVLNTALHAKVKRVALFHYDPASSACDIRHMQEEISCLLKARGVDCEVIASYEGLEIEI